MAFFSTFFFIVHYWKTQFQLSFFRHHSVEIVSKYVSKSTPLFSSAHSTIIKWENKKFYNHFYCLQQRTSGFVWHQSPCLVKVMNYLEWGLWQFVTLSPCPLRIEAFNPRARRRREVHDIVLSEGTYKLVDELHVLQKHFMMPQYWVCGFMGNANKCSALPKMYTS
jgi:hypothetical protein